MYKMSVGNCEGSVQDVQGVYEEFAGQFSIPNYKDRLIALFVKTSEAFDQLTIVVDAANECSIREDLLLTRNQLIEKQNLRLLVSSTNDEIFKWRFMGDRS